VSTGRYGTLNLGDHVGDEPRAVGVNRARVAAAVGLDLADLAVLKATHGNDWVIAERGGGYAVDILVTTKPEIGVLALAADCVDVVLVDVEHSVAAAVHTGWRGVAADTAGTAVAAMATVGADPSETVAHLGPAICPRCYQVSADVRDEVRAAAPASAATTRTGAPAVDLHAGVREQLARAGVGTVTADGRCTAESTELFSHRRDGVTGRHGVAVRLGGWT
jgi:YfiH family protein